MGVLLPRVAAPAFAKRGFTEAAIVTDWAQIVGSDLAAHSAPERIVFPRGKRQGKRRGGGALRLRVAGGIAVELQHLEPEIVERINGYFGFPAVERLVLLQGPLPLLQEPAPRPPRALSQAAKGALETELSVVEDETLRAALRSLGVAVLSRGPDGAKEDGAKPEETKSEGVEED